MNFNVFEYYCVEPFEGPFDLIDSELTSRIVGSGGLMPVGLSKEKGNNCAS